MAYIRGEPSVLSNPSLICFTAKFDLGSREFVAEFKGLTGILSYTILPGLPKSKESALTCKTCHVLATMHRK